MEPHTGFVGRSCDGSYSRDRLILGGSRSLDRNGLIAVHVLESNVVGRVDKLTLLHQRPIVANWPKEIITSSALRSRLAGRRLSDL